MINVDPTLEELILENLKIMYLAPKMVDFEEFN